MPSRCANALTLLLTAALAVNVEFMSARQNPAADPSQPGARDLPQAERLQQEAERHIESRQFKEAAAKLEEALSIRKQRLGESHPDVAQSMGSLAGVAYNLGDYPRAEALAAEALKIREATLGANHALVAESLSDLASMYLVRGDYVRPEPLYLRALKITNPCRPETLRPKHEPWRLAS
jgi:tetratricopeptide (TPR) repeat protein